MRIRQGPSFSPGGRPVPRSAPRGAAPSGSRFRGRARSTWGLLARSPGHWGRQRAMTPHLASRVTPWLRRLDPERAHRLAVTARAWAWPAARPRPTTRRSRSARWASCCPTRSASPPGSTRRRGRPRAAAARVRCRGDGTVTSRPQPGNPRPRVFRLEPDRAVINRYGLNRQGSPPSRPGSRGLRRGRVPVGANVGINKEGADPERDYPRMVAAVAAHVDYVVINVSRPTRPGCATCRARRSSAAS